MPVLPLLSSLVVWRTDRWVFSWNNCCPWYTFRKWEWKKLMLFMSNENKKGHIPHLFLSFSKKEELQTLGDGKTLTLNFITVTFCKFPNFSCWSFSVFHIYSIIKQHKGMWAREIQNSHSNYKTLIFLNLCLQFLRTSLLSTSFYRQ